MLLNVQEVMIIREQNDTPGRRKDKFGGVNELEGPDYPNRIHIELFLITLKSLPSFANMGTRAVLNPSVAERSVGDVQSLSLELYKQLDESQT